MDKNKKAIEKICSVCVLDTTVPEITFDESGSCNYCKLHSLMEKAYPNGKEGYKILKKLVRQIKKSGKGKKYNCVVGVSGGTDSSYALYQTVKLGLRPLAVHFDNSWDSEIAVNNIKKICSKLNVDLYTYVVDWEEFKDLQISFLKASVPDAEIPTDLGIHAVLIKIADKEGIKYVINGHSFRSEGVAPIGWTYLDGKYINSVQKIYGKLKLKSFPNFTIFDYFYYIIIKKTKIILLLNYLNYVKKDAQKILEKELGWEYYGGHHHESIFTHFFQSYLLPKKFNIDKRKTELSSMIRCGLITRSKALKEIQNSSYPYKEEIIEYVIEKLGLTKKEFNRIYLKKPKNFHNYSTYYPLIKFLKLPIIIGRKMHLIPEIIYLKFSAGTGF